MPAEKDFADLLGVLYEGPLETPPWSSFLTLLRRTLAADAVTLLLNSPLQDTPLQLLSDGGSSPHIESYSQGQFVLDPMVNLPHGKVISLREFMSEEELHNSEFYKVILAPQDWYDFLAVDLRAVGELDARLRVGRYRGARRCYRLTRSICRRYRSLHAEQINNGFASTCFNVCQNKIHTR